MIVIISIVYLILGLDDVIIDSLFWISRIQRAVTFRGAKRLDLRTLKKQPQKRIAIFVPCWNERDVVDRMLDFAVRSLDYMNYSIFVGVYPNDPETIAKVESISQRSDRVIAAVNTRPGPSTKADNLNSMYRTMQEYEGDDPFEVIVLHDVEDVIHPLSLLLYNQLTPRKAMVQLPVFPLEREWHKATAWTYADEFAENHLKDMVVRELIGSFVPSAGVGCAFSREALDYVENSGESIFSTESLTEDYQAGLRLRQHGFSTVFVHQRLATAHLHPLGAGAAAYVATRAFFPDTLAAAVRQKARWTVGICVQAWRDHGWSGNFVTRYSLYHDRKAVVSNLVTLLGYCVLALNIALSVAHRFFLWIPEPRLSADVFTLTLLGAVLAISLARVFQRVYFVTAMYGPVVGLLAIPRFPWSALINALATVRALYLVAMASLRHQDVVWHKTAHAFPTAASLTVFKRQLGEILLDEGKITREQLGVALEEQPKSGERLGSVLVRLGFVHEHDVAQALNLQ